MQSVPRGVRYAAIALAVFALSAVAIGTVRAQDEGGRSGPHLRVFPGKWVGGELADDYLGRLADKLGISVDALRDAVIQTTEEMRPQIEERRAELRQRMEENPGGRMHEGVRMVGANLVRLAADELGIDADALRQQLQDGRTLAEIAREHGVDPDVLAERLTQQLGNVDMGALQARIRQLLDRSFTGDRAAPDKGTAGAVPPVLEPAVNVWSTRVQAF
ncbi:MAG: hypothetical protein GEU73_09800 [Chloroflexi bacterium]|nr:hypothetical protein [Chloroflexota bacterium]